MSDKRDDNICVVCRHEYTSGSGGPGGGGGGGGGHKKWIFAIGRCDHWVCYECCTRMRVLCQQNECPICRQQLNEVVFTAHKQKKFDEFDLKKCLYHNNHGIHFEDDLALESYGKLLEHPCRKCRSRQPLKSLHDLNTHLRKEHDLHLCDLCVKNLKLFTHEIKYYTRKELVRHRKSGDPDERSHRGHPICTFCDERYVDDDDLHLHLRREHFYCHFCDPSGLKQFYGDYRALRDHFIADHYLCRECDSQEEKFTNAFSSEIDLQAHITQHHSQNMSKSDLKKAKVISLDLFIHQRTGAPLDNGQQTRKQIKKDARRNPQNHPSHVVDSEMPADGEQAMGAGAAAAPPPPPVQPPRPEDFPTLGKSGGTTILSPNNEETKELVAKRKDKKPSSYSMNVNKSPKINTTNDEDFPALPGGGGPSGGMQMTSLSNITYNSLAKQRAAKAPTFSASKQRNVQLIDSSAETLQLLSAIPSKVIQKHSSGKPMIDNKEEFPSLPVTKKKTSARSAAAIASQSSSQSSASNGFAVRNGGPAIDWFSNGSHLDNNSVKSGAKTKKPEPKPAPKPSPTIDDFPVLETNKKAISFKASPTAAAKPTPKSNKKSKNSAPPGLPAVQKKFPNLSLSSVAQEVIITPAGGPIDGNNHSPDSKEFYYINPIDFTERNQWLVREVDLVLSDSKKFQLFKETSVQFRQSAITGDEYYQKCIELFGRKRFVTIFSELLVLLPDIGKQNELLAARQRDAKGASRGAVPKGFKSLPNDCPSGEFVVCDTCRQVLISKDQSHHLSVH